MKENTATNDLVTVNQDHVSFPTREVLMANFISWKNELYYKSNNKVDYTDFLKKISFLFL